MVTKRDLYEVLSVARTASTDDIKKAYRKAAVKYHPDKNAGDKVAEEKFKEATEAYSILSSSEHRQRYDQFGHAAFEQGAGAGGFGFSGTDFSGFEDIFGDLFGAFFGGGMAGGSRTRGRAGHDLKYLLNVGFEEAVFGAEKEIEIARRVQCGACEGSGAAPGSTPTKCRQCGGAGQQRLQQGFFTISRPCSGCGGSGQTISKPCTECSGGGLKLSQAKIKVKVPAGIDNGQRLKLRGEGEPGSLGGPHGDLYVQVKVEGHAFFERHESELVCEITIPYTTAVLGTTLKVPTLEGEVDLRIPQGTPSGKVFRIKNKGVPILGTNQRGDQHVSVVIEVPKQLSPEKRALLEQLHEIEVKEQAESGKGFFNRVKEIFS